LLLSASYKHRTPNALRVFAAHILKKLAWEGASWVEPTMEVEIRTFREIDLHDGTVIAAFPSSGLVSTIVASYLISMLDSDQVCAIESEDFPPISMVYAKKPKFPARVYAIHQSNVAVFVCEIPPPRGTHRPLARSLLQWSRTHNCKQIVSMEGFPSGKEDEEAEDSEPKVWGVGSTDRAREELAGHNIDLLESGVISGVTGVLLNEGRWKNYDIIALLAEARADLPDAHAAVALTRKLSNLLPELKVELGPLQETSKRLEEYLKRLKNQARPVVPEATATPAMYR
jgi:uncharacterized protein